jgi:putative phage-type endonuclease
MAAYEVNLLQNTPEWLSERGQFIGGSEISSILGTSPWKPAEILFLEKTTGHTEDLSSKEWLFQKGRDREIVGRDAYSLLVLKTFRPAVFRNDKYLFAQVSLDGVSADGEVLEVKFQGTEDFINLSFNGGIPEKYKPQLQYKLVSQRRA